MSERRQLTVVMFADIVGYTALMQHNEDEALILLERFKEELHLTIKECQGEIIQFYGDGCLAVFTNAADAVTSAIILQEEFREKPPVPVRIGIHLGEVLFKEGNIFGDCVNITSRIESMSIPGAVLLSDTVKKQISNNPEFHLTSMGDFEFKNVDDPIEIFSLSNAGFKVPNREQLTGKFKNHKVPKSIAVLPFENMSNDPEQEYFSDGMAEEILSSLTHLQDLKVAGRLSSSQFKGKNTGLREIGEKLGVKTVLQGSVRRQGNRVRITTQLINVDDGYHLWSEKYDRTMDDIFAIQDEIALSVTEALKMTLLKSDRDLLTKSYTQNPEAYELYLKGKFYLNQRISHILTALQYFEKAIETDPGFALPYSGIADASLLMATYGMAPPQLVLPRAKLSAEKALELDPSLCEPYCSLAYYYNTFEWNWAKAKKNYLKSLEINPRYVQAHSWYGVNYLCWVEGKFEEAQQHGQDLIKLEPLSATFYGSYSLILHTAGKLKEALTICQTGIELDSNSYLCYLNEGYIYLAMQEYELAISSLESAVKISNRHHFAVNGLIWTYCLNNEFDKAAPLLDELKERSSKEYISKTFTGISAAYLKSPDEAFDFLEKAFEDKDPVLLALKYEKWGPPAFRDDPRYLQLLERIGFPG
jgi:TolB-like protein/class 3 adenylate cyclase/Tfp pilus assembly protein PilF